MKFHAYATTKCACKRLSMLRLAALIILIASFSTSCKPRQRLTRQTLNLQALSADSLSRVALRWATITITDTILHVSGNDTSTTIRHTTITQAAADTSFTAASHDIQIVRVDTTQTIAPPPLMAKSNQRGGCVALRLAVLVCVLFFMIFLLVAAFVRKK